MAYQGVRMLPTDWDDWRHLVQSAVEMAFKGVSHISRPAFSHLSAHALQPKLLNAVDVVFKAFGLAEVKQ